MSLAYLKELDAQSRIALWKIEETEEQLVSMLQLDEAELAKLGSLAKGKRTLHWLATRVLLRYLLQTPEFISCPSDSNGKPYLPDFPYEISLTHSYDYAGVMLSSSGLCGIDLEIVKDKVVRIKNKFLKPNELEFMQDENMVDQLYASWCAKEAVYKLQGNKGVSFYENMTIHPFHYSPQGVMKVDLIKNNQIQTFNVFYERFNEYMLGYVNI
ncbi:4'-phosphopantetheinyl transferase family protein [Sphingobacterium cellulitidis]|uniref:4'-phosphopantetheinyl transferase n=1 Tax=Sphingobacterium cellulitidis TaxID=1768011 RepID=A0A8H9KXJ4_9SPHI|nr:4'-phosphopantetheinyl transferase superfamily protein [Sphingobacterium soli]MBA8988689.1 phosphopantetheinyl transferase [Sphingobacterium soli]GGE34827.1 4'-phosphopantetheinyl transferase [Sphingobacterium soli]